MTLIAFSDLLEVTAARLVRGDPGRGLCGVSTDTRSLEPGQLFLALSGPSFDGNDFAVEALRRGASGLLLSAQGARLEALFGEAPVALVDDPRAALAQLATWHRGRLSAATLAITGSCGKTSTKNMVAELCRDRLRVAASPASFNNDIGVPHTLLGADERTELLVVEMGTNAPGEIAHLCRMAQPTCGIVTNVGASHLEGLGSVEGVAREKGALGAAIPAAGFLVLNADCRWTPLVREMTGSRVITFSIDGRGDLNAEDVWFHSAGTTFTLEGGREVTLPLLGLHTVQNLLAALAACRGLGLDLDDVLPALPRLRDGRQRMERLELGTLTLFDDSYNSNPESARASVRVLAGLHGHDRRVLVLGEMAELGEFEDPEHYAVGRLAAAAGVDLLVLVGERTRQVAEAALEMGMAPARVVHFESLESALEGVDELLRDGDVVLVKASRAARLERLVAHIVERRSGEDVTAGVAGG